MAKNFAVILMEYILMKQQMENNLLCYYNSLETKSEDIQQLMELAGINTETNIKS